MRGVTQPLTAGGFAAQLGLVASSWALVACDGSVPSGTGTVPSVTSAFIPSKEALVKLKRNPYTPKPHRPCPYRKSSSPAPEHRHGRPRAVERLRAAGTGAPPPVTYYKPGPQVPNRRRIRTPNACAHARRYTRRDACRALVSSLITFIVLCNERKSREVLAPLHTPLVH